MTTKPPVDDVTDDHIEVGKPRTWAAGVPGITHSMGPALTQMGVRRSLKTLTAMNQKDGFDCMSCAWPDPDHRTTLSFCENGAKALHLGGHTGQGSVELLGRALDRRPAHEVGVLAGHAGSSHRAGP